MDLYIKANFIQHDSLNISNTIYHQYTALKNGNFLYYGLTKRYGFTVALTLHVSKPVKSRLKMEILPRS